MSTQNMKNDNGKIVYQAIITQASTAAPTEDKVLTNRFNGTAVYARTGAGIYTLTYSVADSFPALLTVVDVSKADTIDADVTAIRTSGVVITITSSAVGVVADDVLTNQVITVWAYNA